MTLFRGQISWAKTDITWRQANSTSMPFNQKVNKAEELTYLSINVMNIGKTKMADPIFEFSLKTGLNIINCEMFDGGADFRRSGPSSMDNWSKSNGGQTFVEVG